VCAERKPQRTTGDYDLWIVGQHEVMVSGTVSGSTFKHTLSAIVDQYVADLLEAHPDLQGVRGLLSGILTSEVAVQIDHRL